jgi:ADP-heptose:LPS heptosyltransferase
MAAQIKARLPEAKISWLVEPPARALLENNKAVDEVIVFEKKDLTSKLKNPLSLGTGISQIRALGTTLSAKKFDLAIDAQGLLKSALLAWGSKAPIRVGFKGAREGSNLLLTDTLDVGDYYGPSVHVVDHNLALAEFAIQKLVTSKKMVPLPPPAVVKFPLPIPETSVRQEVERLIRGLPSGSPLAPPSTPQIDGAPPPEPAGGAPPPGPAGGAPPPGLIPPPGSSLFEAQAPESIPPLGQAHGDMPPPLELEGKIAVIIPGTTWATKVWPVQRWIDLCASLLACGLDRLIICGGKADAQTNQSISIGINSLFGKSGAAGDSVPFLLNLTGKTDLIQLISLFEMTDLVVGADTGPLHLAAAVDRPLVVAVHGSTPWLRNGPYGARGRAVFAQIPCQPCFSKTCALTTIECLRDLPADRVLALIAGEF